MSRAELIAAIDAAVRARDGREERGEIRHRCVAHDDEHPSARWHPTRHVWRCDACGAGGGYTDLARRLGLDVGAARNGAGRERVWTLRDASGTAVAEHVRVDHEGGKRMWWRRPDGTRGLGGLRTRCLPLYGAERLASVEKGPGTLVALVEGERAADALTARGIVAVGTVTGASATPSDDTLGALTGRHVVLWPDADAPGRAHMQRIAARLAMLGAVVRWYDPAPEATDGRDAADDQRDADALRAALAAAPMWRAETPPECDAPWPDPLPLEPPAPPPFPLAALPPALADQVADVARVVQVPPDLPGALALGVVAAGAARRAVVALGDGPTPTHVEPLCLYVAAVSPSGTRKSAALHDMLLPLYARERLMQQDAEPDVRVAVERRKLAEARLDALRKRQAREQDADERERLCAEAEALARELPQVPALPRLVVDDRTPEALALDLEEQAGAVLLASAEGADLFAVAAGRHVRDGGDQATVYLHAYDGERLDVRRITREAVRVDDPALSIAITPQPIVLERLREHPELHHRGLVPRFALVVAPDLAGRRRYDATATPDQRVRSAYGATLERILTLPRPVDATAVPRLRLSGAALDVWRQYHDRVERDLADGGRLAPIREWASKQAGRVARIAGGLHLVATVGSGRPWADLIQADTVTAAVRLGEHLEAHALVGYDLVRADPRLRLARAILRFARRTGAATITQRDAHAHAVSHGPDRTVEAVADACGLLVDHGWLRPRPVTRRPGPGRPPSPAYDVHPAVAAGDGTVDIVDGLDEVAV